MRGGGRGRASTRRASSSATSRRCAPPSSSRGCPLRRRRCRSRGERPIARAAKSSATPLRRSGSTQREESERQWDELVQERGIREASDQVGDAREAGERDSVEEVRRRAGQARERETREGECAREPERDVHERGAVPLAPRRRRRRGRRAACNRRGSARAVGSPPAVETIAAWPMKSDRAADRHRTPWPAPISCAAASSM